MKRRKVDATSASSKKQPVVHQDDLSFEQLGKKEAARSTKLKGDKREKTDEEKELRKERKLGRKRDRADEALLGDLKRRKEEEKAYLASKMSMHQNGEADDRYHMRVRRSFVDPQQILI